MGGSGDNASGIVTSSGGRGSPADLKLPKRNVMSPAPLGTSESPKTSEAKRAKGGGASVDAVAGRGAEGAFGGMVVLDPRTTHSLLSSSTAVTRKCSQAAGLFASQLESKGAVVLSLPSGFKPLERISAEFAARRKHEDELPPSPPPPIRHGAPEDRPPEPPPKFRIVARFDDYDVRSSPGPSAADALTLECYAAFEGIGRSLVSALSIGSAACAPLPSMLEPPLPTADEHSNSFVDAISYPEGSRVQRSQSITTAVRSAATFFAACGPSPVSKYPCSRIRLALYRFRCLILWIASLTFPPRLWRSTSDSFFNSNSLCVGGGGGRPPHSHLRALNKRGRPGV